MIISIGAILLKDLNGFFFRKGHVTLKIFSGNNLPTAIFLGTFFFSMINFFFHIIIQIIA
jgi:hypothetical protein